MAGASFINSVDSTDSFGALTKSVKTSLHPLILINLD